MRKIVAKCFFGSKNNARITSFIFDDNATYEEIDKTVSQWAYNEIDYDWKEVTDDTKKDIRT